MPLTLEKVVPWGRSLDEYVRMFSLNEADLSKRILGCADGPASFNADLTEAGGSVVSCDPVYQFSSEQIRQRIDESADQIIDYARHNINEFVWSEQIPNPDRLAEHRMTAMSRFLDDFAVSHNSERYVAAELPNFPFERDSFDLAVCSHFLFLYSEQLSEQFHVDSLRNLLTLAKEVRIFPLLELGAIPSRHLDAVRQSLQDDGYQISLETVAYEFQRGGNEMMRITR